jgi:hypothetical protein
MTFIISHASYEYILNITHCDVYFLNITLTDITLLNVTHIISSQFYCLLAEFQCNIMVIMNITPNIITNLNITLILFIIFRYHTVDYLLKCQTY